MSRRGCSGGSPAGCCTSKRLKRRSSSVGMAIYCALWRQTGERSIVHRWCASDDEHGYEWDGVPNAFAVRRSRHQAELHLFFVHPTFPFVNVCYNKRGQIKALKSVTLSEGD